MQAEAEVLDLVLGELAVRRVPLGMLGEGLAIPRSEPALEFESGGVGNIFDPEPATLEPWARRRRLLRRYSSPRWLL